jgi:hypothetical protein
MDNQSNGAGQPPRRRRRRPQGRWSNPASPLQAARFDKRLSGKEVITAIRAICAGHADRPCKIDVAKLSDYETRNRRPGLTHIEAFCRYYQRSPEQLGLIHWRDENEDENAGKPGSTSNGNHANPTDETALLHSLDGSLHTAATLLASLAAGELPLDDDVAIDRVLLDLISGTVALTAVTTHVLRASRERHTLGRTLGTGALV